jgi:nitronate monooxygenase
VAQGMDAGGHVRGTIGTFSLVPAVVDAVAPVPVLAAGGIADARGVAAAFALGAAGIWVGTRFVASAEANAHSDYVAALIASAADDTVYSQLFDGGWPNAPLRTLRNSTVRNWKAAGSPPPGKRPGEGQAAATRAGAGILRYDSDAPTRAVSTGAEAMALYAGQGVGLIRHAPPAREVVAELAKGLPQAIPASARM